MKDKLNVLHWMVTFVTLLGFVVFYFLIDDQRKRTMMALENSDSLLAYIFNINFISFWIKS